MARQSLALCFVGDDLRAKSRHFVLCAPKRHLRAAVLASSRKPCGGADPKRRAKSPALQSRRERAMTDKSQPSARPVGGPMQASAPTQGGDHAVGAAQQRRHRPLRRGAAAPGAVARIRYIVGRAFTPAGEGCEGGTLWFCVSAAPQGRGGLRQPGRVLAGRGAAPLSRLTPLPVCGIRIMRRTLKRACILRPLHLLRLAVSAAGGARLRSPLQGSLLGGSRLQSLPCKGRWMRRKAQTEGCIASWRRRYPAKFGRTLPRLRRGRCWHHPGTLRRRKAPSGGRKRPPYIAAGSGR